MEIRTYKAQDEAGVVALWKTTGLTVAWNDPRRDIARKLEADPEGFLVGEVEGRIAATAMVGYDGHRGSVFYFCVDPRFQGRGLARRLMEHAEAYLLRKGCPKVNVMVRTSNLQAVGLYGALGYQKDEVICLGKRLIPD